jgi:hypothetical protein
MSDLSLPYSVRAAAVAAWDWSTEQYGTPVTLQNVQSAKGEPVMDNDVLKMRGVNRRGLAVMIGNKMTLGFGGVHWPSLSIMTGLTDESSGGTVLHRHHTKGGLNLPYFGLCLAFPLDDGGEFHGYYPLGQLTKHLPLSIEQNKFALPEIEVQLFELELTDGTELDMFDYKTYGAETALPTDFNATFGIS